MKLRQRPEDFVVEEIINLPPQNSSAPYTFYLLQKKNISTFEVSEIISRIWKISKQNIGYCGLKDKYSLSTQYISIKNGPEKDIELKTFSLHWKGKISQSLRIGDLIKNSFRITVRDLKDEQCKKIEERIPEIKIFGFPNYFDYQRFGSVRPTGEFITKYLLKKDYETALKFILTKGSKYEKRKQKNIRKLINQYWSNWEKIFSLLPKSSERNIVNFLKSHPTEFKTAFELINRNLRFLIVTSYQSYLWNEIVKLFLKKNLSENNLIPIKYNIEKFIFELLFYQTLPGEKLNQWKDFSLPLPVHQLELENSLREIYEEILRKEDLTLADFKLHGMKKTYFPKDERKIIVFPENLKINQIGNDLLNKNRLALELEFSLPSGSYATLLVKRLTIN